MVDLILIHLSAWYSQCLLKSQYHYLPPHRAFRDHGGILNTLLFGQCINAGASRPKPPDPASPKAGKKEPHLENPSMTPAISNRTAIGTMILVSAVIFVFLLWLLYLGTCTSPG